MHIFEEVLLFQATYNNNNNNNNNNNREREREREREERERERERGEGEKQFNLSCVSLMWEAGGRKRARD